MISVSIVLSCYNRASQLVNTLESIARQNYRPLEVIVVEDGYDGGRTEAAARNFGARYYARRNRADLPTFQNPSRIHNIGIRRANNDVVILQGGEVRYDTLTGIRDMVEPIEQDASLSTFAMVKSLDQQGNFFEWYSHPTEGARAGWMINFCQAATRDKLWQIRGFDESFAGYGGEDVDFEQRLQLAGTRLVYSTALCSHQWHPRPGYGSVEFSGGRSLGWRANEGIEWGRL